MVKRMLIVAVLGLVGACTAASSSEAGIFYRPIAPVRRVVTRTVLPPYPVVRHVVGYPAVVAPYYGPAYGPVIYGSPYVYGGGVTFGLGY